MSFSAQTQNSGHQPPNTSNSTTVWTQPSTPEQRRYYSKHAGERRVFGWITTIFQTAHGFIAFAAWSALYIWVFSRVPALLFLAPILACASLFALHVLFRTTWQTYWYDRLDDDPNTDSPVWVPAVILLLLWAAEYQGARMYLAGQVRPPEKQTTGLIDSMHATTVASFEQSYTNDQARIEAVYKAKESAATAPFDGRIRRLRAKSADTDAERRSIRGQIASLQAQRDAAIAPVQQAKAAELEKAYQHYSAAKTSETDRRSAAVAAVDAHNNKEVTRHDTELSSVGSYAWAISIGLLILIAGLSYRCVRINVKSGIIPLRNYTVLDAHGSLPERIWTAISDAINRRGLQFAVWMHRLLSPKQAITSFDGTVVAQPGTYNTPEGFHQRPATLPAGSPDSDLALRNKVAEKIMREAAAKKVVITPEMLQQEFEKAKTMNGTYKDTPLGEPKPSATPTPTAPAAEGDDEPRWINFFRNVFLSRLSAYDEAVAAGKPSQAEVYQNAINDPTDMNYRLGKRLGLAWGIDGGNIVVWRERNPARKVKLENLTKEALDGDPASGSRPAADEPEDLFKQNLTLFKQTIQPQTDPETGKVIGIRYKKAKSDDWVTYPYSQVKAYWTNYVARCEKSQSPANIEGLEKWEYALSLFDEGRAELKTRFDQQVKEVIL